MHVTEPPQERRFVRHTVLHADDRRAGRGVVEERGGDAGRVLALDGDQHDIVAGERQIGGMGDDRDRQRDRALGPLDREAARGDRRAVRAAGDEHDVVAVLEHAPADDPTDGAGAVDDEAHGQADSGS